MSDPVPRRTVHISSAVVSAFPERCAEVVARIEAMTDTEVHRVEGGKIVVVMEGASTGEIGARLAEIGLLDGVLAANMVFEQIEELDDIGVNS